MEKIHHEELHQEDSLDDHVEHKIKPITVNHQDVVRGKRGVVR